MSSWERRFARYAFTTPVAVSRSIAGGFAALLGVLILVFGASSASAAFRHTTIADAFGSAPLLRSGDDILAQVRADRDEWGDR